MASHPVPAVDLPEIPFITDARIVALPGLDARGGIVVTWHADTGQGPRTIARSLASADDIEALGHALLSVAAVARLNKAKRDGGAQVLPGHAPRADVKLMRSVRTADTHSIVTMPLPVRREGLGA
jgi:hypothetical protein